MILKDFIPPVLAKLVNRYRGHKDIQEFKDYTQAMKSCTSDAYQNTELCNMIAEKTVIHIKKLKEKPFSLNPTDVFLLSAINQYINVHLKKSLTILDFGGACGVHYFEMRRFLSKDISLKWIVLETDQMVKSSIDSGLHSDELVFVTSIEDIKWEIDFVHSSGALQYVPNPYEFTEMLVNLNANVLFVNRMMFNEVDRDFVTIQNSMLSANGPGKLPANYTDRNISYPHTTMSYQKFNSMSPNYDLEWIFKESSGSYQINDEKIIGRGLLYVLKV